MMSNDLFILKLTLKSMDNCNVWLVLRAPSPEAIPFKTALTTLVILIVFYNLIVFK